jgi:molybdopterin molybdotransferase
MITVAEARQIILDSIRPLEPRTTPLGAALDCVLAADVVSSLDLPTCDNSAVDGFAVRAADLAGVSENNPIHLRVIEELPAGRVPTRALEPQTCARIFTGAPISPGANAVVMQEHTRSHHEGYIAVSESVEPGDNIRRGGEDVTAGQVVLRAGALLGPAQLAMAAAVGVAALRAHPRPRVGVLVTGAELVEPGRPLPAGRIYDSNSFLLTALTRRAGCEPVELGIADDTREDLREKIEYALGACDVLVSVGGVSVGEYDLVRAVLAELGCEQKFWQVAMKPGKPLVFGVAGDCYAFGLPGNPVSAAVTFLVLARPALLKLRGLGELDLPSVSAEAEEEFINGSDRLHFMRARLRREAGRWLARPLSRQGSHVISSLADADALVAVPGQTTLGRGARVEAMWLGG